MKTKSTMRDVAELAGVSISSISRYIKEPSSINPVAAVKVAQAIRELDYHPNLFAQNLRRGYNDTIGVIVPDLNSYFSKVCEALNRFFYQNEYLLFVCDTNEDPEKERYYIRSLIQQRVAGMLISSSGKNNGLIRETAGEFRNLVQFDRYEPDIGIDSILENNVENAALLTTYMIEKGYDRFLLLYGPTISVNTQYRTQGTRQALTGHGLDYDKMRVVTDIVNTDQVYQAVKAATDEKNPPRAIIAFNPAITESAVMAMNMLNLKDRMELAGFTLGDFRDKFRYDIPRIIQNPYDMGMKAGEVLLKRLKKPSANKMQPKKYIVDTRLAY